MTINKATGYYTVCLEAAIAEGITAGNYRNAIADCILHKAQLAIGKDMSAFDVLATARGELRRDTPNNPYF
jgi:hypothetical protein